MKVLFVASGNNKKVSPFVLDQARALESSGIEIDFYLIKGNGIFGYLKNFKSFKKKINSFNPDIIHAHYGLSGLLTVLQNKVPTIVTFHGSDINKKKSRFFSNIAIKFSADSIFVSKNLADMVNAKNPNIIPCGVDLDVFYPMNNLKVRQKLNFDIEKKYILFSSFFENSVKNYPLAKEAISLLSNQTVELLELKGFSRDQVSELMNAVDLVLMTSQTEGSPQFIKEAMACNTPIVSVDVGDVKDIIGTIKGCFIAEYNAQSVANKIGMALNFAKKTTGREYINNYDNKTIAKKVIDVYKLVLNE
jgi:glycosyltransferase involved in cell wall biosynthesis